MKSKIFTIALVLSTFSFINAQYDQVGNKLIGSGNIVGSGQGYSLSSSADGKTIIVGGPEDNSGVGAAWVYTYNGNTFVQVGNKLVGTGAIGTSYQGATVSLSDDGKTALVGGYGDNSDVGACWVFTYNGTNFVQVGSKLVGGGQSNYQSASNRGGQSVGLSADGKIAVVGDPSDNSSLGAVWVYTYNGSNFVQFGNKLVGSGSSFSPRQGSSVDISANGKTIIIGGPKDGSFSSNNGYGACWIFSFNGNNFIQVGNKLVTNLGSRLQGTSVSLSDDGKTAISGNRSDIGSALIYTFDGTNFIKFGNELVGSGGGNSQFQGHSVRLSGDGKSAIVGGPSFPTNGQGAVWIYTNTGNSFIQLGDKLSGEEYSWQGSSVGITTDGKTIIVGGTGYKNDNNEYTGAIVIYSSNLQNQTINGMSLIANSYPYGSPSIDIFNITASSGLPVTFNVTKLDDLTGVITNNDTSVISITGNQLRVIGVGLVTVTANQIGNLQFKSTSNAIVINVTKASQTITGMPTLLNSYTFGSFPISVSSVSVSSGLPVSIVSSNPSVVSVTGTQLIFLGSGNTTITTSQFGNENFNAAQTIYQVLTVNKANQTISGFTPLSTKTYGDSDFTINGVSASSGLPVTFSTSNASVANIFENTVSILNAGTTTITATQIGNNNFNSAPNISIVLKVNKADQTISFLPIANQTINGNNLNINLSGTTNSGLIISYSLNTNPNGIASINGNSLTINNTGIISINASQIGDYNYNAATVVSHSFQISSLLNSTSGINTLAGGNTMSGSNTATGTNITPTVTGIASPSPLVPNNTAMVITINGSGFGTGTTITIDGVVLQGTITGNVLLVFIPANTVISTTAGIAIGNQGSGGTATQPISSVNVSSGTTNLQNFHNTESVTFEIYPNPTSGTFTLKLSNASPGSVAVYNSIGQQVATLSAGEATLPKGFYLLRCGSQGKKLIVE